jgi:hypothetical protein
MFWGHHGPALRADPCLHQRGPMPCRLLLLRPLRAPAPAVESAAVASGRGRPAVAHIQDTVLDAPYPAGCTPSASPAPRACSRGLAPPAPDRPPRPHPWWARTAHTPGRRGSPGAARAAKSGGCTPPRATSSGRSAGGQPPPRAPESGRSPPPRQTTPAAGWRRDHPAATARARSAPLAREDSAPGWTRATSGGPAGSAAWHTAAEASPPAGAAALGCAPDGGRRATSPGSAP